MLDVCAGDVLVRRGKDGVYAMCARDVLVRRGKDGVYAMWSRELQHEIQSDALRAMSRALGLTIGVSITCAVLVQRRVYGCDHVGC